MPYIEQEQRREIEQGRRPQTVGELTYKITTIIEDYLIDRRLSFSTIGEIQTALHFAGTDFQNEIVNDYEFVKKTMNGAIWDPIIEYIEKP